MLFGLRMDKEFSSIGVNAALEDLDRSPGVSAGLFSIIFQNKSYWCLKNSLDERKLCWEKKVRVQTRADYEIFSVSCSVKATME